MLCLSVTKLATGLQLQPVTEIPPGTEKGAGTLSDSTTLLSLATGRHTCPVCVLMQYLPGLAQTAQISHAGLVHLGLSGQWVNMVGRLLGFFFKS